MIVLPQGTLRRALFEKVDRALGRLFFGNDKTVSTNLGDRIYNGTAPWWQRWIASQIDALVFEYGHCLKNAGKVVAAGAAVVGYTGQYTVSAECGKSECKACKLVCAFLHLLDRNHCANSSAKEGR